jgi:hypothetical protein
VKRRREFIPGSVEEREKRLFFADRISKREVKVCRNPDREKSEQEALASAKY